MRILLFFVWLTLGLVYFLIWNQRDQCCNPGSIQEPGNINPSSSTSNLNTALIPESQNGVTPSSTPNNTLKSSLIEDSMAGVQGCLLFKWGESDPLTRPCFTSWRDSIIKSLSDGQMIEIIGEYFERENQVMASGDVGLLRAVKAKKLFQASIDESRLKVRSKSVAERDSVEYKLFQSLQVHTVFYNELIKELDEKTLIYFAYGVEDQLNNQLLEAYATYLVQKLKNTKDELLVVGHTDDDATAESNRKLGLQRAELVKYLLVSKGFNSARIKTSSKGESSPIAPNDTEQNRTLNRRVELFIIPQQSK